jgi:hypothetical protein
LVFSTAVAARRLWKGGSLVRLPLLTKVVQRVPVKIVLDPDQQSIQRLRDGLSVIASVSADGARQ